MIGGNCCPAVHYLKARILKLDDQQRIVSLIIDEVYYTQQKTEYVHSNCFLCLMVRSIAGLYCDVIAMLTVSNLNVKMQTDLWTKNIEILEEIGCDVVITLSDGNGNHKFFKNIGGKILQDYIRNPLNFS